MAVLFAAWMLVPRGLLRVGSPRFYGCIRPTVLQETEDLYCDLLCISGVLLLPFLYTWLRRRYAGVRASVLYSHQVLSYLLPVWLVARWALIQSNAPDNAAVMSGSLAWVADLWKQIYVQSEFIFGSFLLAQLILLRHMARCRRRAAELAKASGVLDANF